MVKILVVDDESRTRSGLCALISQSGLPVEVVGTAANGTDGLNLAQEQIPDIILTDVRMPKMDGIAFAQEVRKLLPDCQIVFLSGYSEKEYLKAAIRIKAVNYLEKPIREEELADTLNACITQIEENHRKKDQMLLSQSVRRQHRDSVGAQLTIELLNPQLQREKLALLLSYFPEFEKTDPSCTLICQLKYLKDREDNSLIAEYRLREVLERSDAEYLLGGKKSHLFVMHIKSCEQQGTEELMECISGIYREITTALSEFADVFLAVGSVVCSYEELSQSYINAVICLQNLFFTGYSHMCCFSSADEEMGKSYQLDAGQLQRFAQVLDAGNITEAEFLVKQFFYEMRKSQEKLEINSIKHACYQLLCAVDENRRESGQQSFVWNDIAGVDTIFALQELLIKKIKAWGMAVREKEGISPLVQRIHQYVEKHYQDTALSVSGMARDLHFTTAYLCNVHKEETGETIVSYINTFRVEKAKELLKKRDTKVYDVSCAVGYATAHYFNKQFKKQVGMTPSEYREKHIL